MDDRPIDDMDRLELGMEILARLEAGKDLLPSGREHTDGRQTRMEHSAYPPPFDTLHVQVPFLQEILADMAPMPPFTALIGSCDDTLPVTLDLTDPAAGSLLLMADAGCGKTALIRSILVSACATNSPRDFRFCCIARTDSALVEILDYPHSYRASAPYETAAVDMIGELVYLADQRSSGRNLGGPVILAIENLAELERKLEQESRRLLAWLVKNGPSSQVWVIAGVEASQYLHLDRSLVAGFRTWLVGAITSSSSGAFMSPDLLRVASSLAPGLQFAACLEGSWVRFWIPQSS